MTAPNQRTAANAHERYRWANGGLVRASTAAPGELAAMARAGGTAALSVYGDSPAARSLRASDIRRRRTLSDGEWAALMASRAASFGLPLERLLAAARGAAQ